MLNIIPIRAFTDNYIWLMVNNQTKTCAAVDPGDASPVITYLESNDLTLCDILITHHHNDHTGGIQDLRRHCNNPTVYAPANNQITHVDRGLSDGEVIHLDSIGTNFTVLEIPGHTKDHIAYFGEEMLFCGDTLFSAGCGRVFEGTFAQMFQSLEKITRLPANTAIYCAHEYTEANLAFAKIVEPSNNEIIKRMEQVRQLREHNHPTLPSTLELEKKTNPFLRCHVAEVILYAQHKSNENKSDPLFVFQTIRTWKDSFR